LIETASGWCCWIIICDKSTIYYFFICVGVVMDKVQADTGPQAP
jgi:hypothetical protein